MVDLEVMRNLVCSRLCPFYKEGESLVCGALEALIKLVDEGRISLDDLESIGSLSEAEGRLSSEERGR